MTNHDNQVRTDFPRLLMCNYRMGVPLKYRYLALLRPGLKYHKGRGDWKLITRGDAYGCWICQWYQACRLTREDKMELVRTLS